MGNSASVKLRTTWAELFTKEMPGDERRQRWETWKKMAIAAGDKDLVEYWQDPSGCIGCVALLDDCWCDRTDLPCTVNPYLTMQYGMIGMACMGMGYDDGVNQGELPFDGPLPF